MNKALSIACAMALPLLCTQSAFADFSYSDAFKTDGSFKRFSASIGWLHAAPQGEPTDLANSTVITEGYDAGEAGGIAVNGLEKWNSPGTGLEADSTNTVGLLFNYFVNDQWSFEVKAGIPPEVDVLGKGTVFAPAVPGSFDAAGNFNSLSGIIPDEGIQVTDMFQGDGVAATARAWLPAAEVHYQFGKQGVDKFRPYVGIGGIYAHFADIELDSAIEQDLKVAAGRVQLIKDDKAIESIGSKETIVNNVNAQVESMDVNVEADDDFAPMFTLGATYDINEDMFVVGSVTYASLDSDNTIEVKNAAGEKLIEATGNIDIDPYITYLGVGYRF